MICFKIKKLSFYFIILIRIKISYLYFIFRKGLKQSIKPVKNSPLKSIKANQNMSISLSESFSNII